MRQLILAAILDFVKETEKHTKKNYQTNSPGPVCILQIFGNNLSEGFRVKAETSGGGGGGGRTQQKPISLHHHIVGGDLNMPLILLLQ